MGTLAVLIFLALMQCNLLAENSFYDMLKVSKDADQHEIRKAFRKLALVFHPDRNMNDKHAHEKFVEISRAYEILKHENTRRQYDLYGEAALNESPESSSRYQSWTYRKHGFGIFDDSPEIVTIRLFDFERRIRDTNDRWFINFYSPRCHHCHEFAPIWQQLARELEDILMVGAVNCIDDADLCARFDVEFLPALIMLPEEKTYTGPRNLASLVKFALHSVNPQTVQIHQNNFDRLRSDSGFSLPWVIEFGANSDDSVLKENRKKLAGLLNGLANVGFVYCDRDATLCSRYRVASSSVVYFPNNKFELKDKKILNSFDVRELYLLVLGHLPRLGEISLSKLEKIATTQALKHPLLVQFIHVHAPVDVQLRKLPRLVRNLNVRMVAFDCKVAPVFCEEKMYLRNYPKFVMFKTTGGYEVYDGKTTVNEIMTFVREAAATNIRFLTPSEFPVKVVTAGQIWFVEFFAEGCLPCKLLFLNFRQTAKLLGDAIRFGIVDCDLFQDLCRTASVQVYPTIILYNNSVGSIFVGYHSVNELLEFIEDMRSSLVIQLTGKEFEMKVLQRGPEKAWVVNFFATWCYNCIRLTTEYATLSKLVQNRRDLHVAVINCDHNEHVCSAMGIHSYPTIRLFPAEYGTPRDYDSQYQSVLHLRQWIYSHLPRLVTEINHSAFYNEVTAGKHVWLIYFYVPSCRYCEYFQLIFDTVSEVLQGDVKCGKVNCQLYPEICRSSGVNLFPTVRLYLVKEESNGASSYYGIDIPSRDLSEILNIVMENLQIESNSDTNMDDRRVKEEL